MTDTPRSLAYDGDCFFLAQDLERELNATRQAFSDYMTKTTIEADELKHEIGNLRQHIELLRAKQ